MALCNPPLKDYMKGRKCLRVHDVAMSSLCCLFFSLPLPTLTPPSRPSLGPHFPRRGKLLRPRRQPNTNSQWQFESVRLTGSWLWLRTVTERQAERVHTRAAEPRRRTEGCLVLLCESFTRLHGPLSGSREHGTACVGRNPVWRQRSLLVVCSGRILSWGSLRKREGSSPHFWCGRQPGVESCSVLSGAWAGKGGFYRPTWAGNRSILSARGASESCTDTDVWAENVHGSTSPAPAIASLTSHRG